MPDWSGVEENESEHVVEERDTLYGLAYDTYDDPLLMYVLAARNHLDLPDAQLYKGMKLKIPNRDWVESKLITQGRTLRKTG
jgi:nucleoid-associated protein YgaU